MPAHERRLSRCKTRSYSITNVEPMAPRMIRTRCSKKIGGDALERSLRRSRIPGSHPLTRVSAGSLLPPIEHAESAAEPELLVAEKVHGFFLPGNLYLLVPGDVYTRAGWN